MNYRKLALFAGILLAVAGFFALDLGQYFNLPAMKAQQANLSGKENWRKYPMAMLTARSITECARDACPEALYGVVYTGEEGA